MRRIPVINVFTRKPIFIKRTPVIKDSRRILQVNTSDFDWVKLERDIWDCRDKGILVTLITSVDLPERVVWAASYSENNILEINLNLLQKSRYFPWISRLLHLSNNCGLYARISFTEIIPTKIKSYHIIDIIDRLYSSGTHEILLDFNNVDLEDATEYIQSFVQSIDLFCVPRKVPVVIAT